MVSARPVETPSNSPRPPDAPTPGHQRPPRVSVGLYVYNGARHVAETIESILAQTFTDFELIISDNGSTDATEAICRDYAGRDARIAYHRSPVNRGMVWNADRVFELGRGELFAWIGHHDLWAPTLLERLVAALDAHPKASLAHSCFQYIDEDGRLLPNRPPLDLYPMKDLTGLSTVERMDRLLHYFPYHAFVGLHRRALIKSFEGPFGFFMVRPLRHPNPDALAVFRLALVGDIALVPEPLYFSRTSLTHNDIWELDGRMRTLNPSLKGRVLFPKFELLRDFFHAVRLADLSAAERVGVARSLLTRWTAPRARGILLEFDLLHLYPRYKRLLGRKGEVKREVA